MKLTPITLTVPALLSLFATGCVGSPEVAGDTPVASSAPKLSQTLVWSEQLAAGHTVSFYELGEGLQGTMEEGTPATAPLVSPELIQSGLAAVYAQLKPGAPVPAALLESDSRSLALRAAQPAAPAAPTAEATLSPVADLTSGERAALEGVHPETAADNAWFIQTFCNVAAPYNADQCQAGWGWADVVSGAAGFAWQSFADVGDEGTVNAPYYGDFWSCWNSGFLGLGTTCGYNRGFTDSVPPGHWHSWTGSYTSGFNPRDFHFNISGANATVGLISKFNVFRAVPIIVPVQ